MPTSARSSGGGLADAAAAAVERAALPRSALNVSPRNGSWTTAASVSPASRQAIETAHCGIP